MKNFTGFKYGNYTKKALKPNAVPSLFVCQNEKYVDALPRTSSLQRAQKKLVKEVLSDDIVSVPSVMSPDYAGMYGL